MSANTSNERFIAWMKKEHPWLSLHALAQHQGVFLSPTTRAYHRAWEAGRADQEAKLQRYEAALQEIASDEYNEGSGYCHPEGCYSPLTAKKALEEPT